MAKIHNLFYHQLCFMSYLQLRGGSDGVGSKGLGKGN